MRLSNSGGSKIHAIDTTTSLKDKKWLTIYHKTDWNRLLTMEALLILQNNPQINKQITGMHITFKLHQ